VAVVERELAGEGVQRDPIVVDSASSVVLDGMHRLAALRVLGAELAVCALVDYRSDAVSIGRWGRIYTVTDGGRAAEVLSRAGLTQKMEVKAALAKLEAGEVGIAGLTIEGAFAVPGGAQDESIFDVVRAVDSAAMKEGWAREFVPDFELGASIGRGRVALLPRRLTKDDVVRAAVRRKLFPCKTSMHALDPRPVSVNYPITGLMPGSRPTPLPDPSRARLLPADSTYHGRRYKERLLMLSEG
jgi:hypothetical protein